jgi:chemotaxis protein methyltransferase CheR
VLNGRLGIKLPPEKRGMLEMRLRPRLRQLGYARFDGYCRYLFEAGGLAAEMQHLIDAVTTNKTDFFREPEHFTLLRESIVPALLERRQGEQGPLLKLWSAACSTGAEAYTMAMVLEEMRRARPSFRFSVLGTDISAQVLERADEAVYPAEMVLPVPSALKQRYLMSSIYGGQGAVVRVIPELRQRTRFLQLNLMDQSYRVDRDVDVIFLRNVLIYFEPSDQDAVVQRMLSHLRPGGVLILGHAEAAIGSRLGLNDIGFGAFRKD